MVSPARMQIELQPGEKITPVMIYTLNSLAWGSVVTKEAIRVSLWLRTPMAPQYISLLNAQVMSVGGSEPGKPQPFRELLIPSSQVVAIHLTPPESDPLDYDPDEPHRKMAPTTALVGSFRFDGKIRMSDMTDLNRYLDVSTETFTPLYEVEISQPAIPALGVIRVPFCLLRREMFLFSPRD